MTRKRRSKRLKNGCSYARTFSSNFWVLWQPPIGNVTPYFRGLVPYGTAELGVAPIMSLFQQYIPSGV